MLSLFSLFLLIFYPSAGDHGGSFSRDWLYFFSHTHHMVNGILFTTLLLVGLGPKFKARLRRSRMSFPAGLMLCSPALSLQVGDCLPSCLLCFGTQVQALPFAYISSSSSRTELSSLPVGFASSFRLQS